MVAGDQDKAHKIWPALLAAAVAAVFYLATLSRNYLGDGVKFALQVERWEMADLLQPRHLAYPWVGWCLSRLAQILGSAGRGLELLQVLSAFGGAACVGLLFALASRLGGSRRVGMLVAAGFGVSRGVWLYATDAESVTLSLALGLGVLWGLLGRDGSKERPSRPVAVGLLWGVSVLVHASNLLILPTMVAGYWAMSKGSLRERLTRIGLCLGMGAATIAMGYGMVSRLVWGREDTLSIARVVRMLGLSEWSAWGASDLAQGAYGFLKALVGYPGLGPDASTAVFVSQSGRAEIGGFVAYYGVAALVAAAPLAGSAWSKLKRSTTRDHWALAILAAWAVAHAVAAVLWVPGDVQFWVPVLAAWWLVVALSLRPAEGHHRPMGPRIRWVLLISLVGLIMAANAWSFALPNRSLANNRIYQVSASLMERTEPDDIIMVTGGDRLELYLLYFADRQPLLLYELLTDETMAEQDLARAIVARAERAAAAGGRLYLAGFAPGAEVRWHEVDSQGVARGVLKRVPISVAWQVAGERIFVVSPP